MTTAMTIPTSDQTTTSDGAFRGGRGCITCPIGSCTHIFNRTIGPLALGTCARTHPASPHTPASPHISSEIAEKQSWSQSPYRLVTRTRTRTMLRKGSAKVVTPRLRLCGRRRSPRASRHEGRIRAQLWKGARCAVLLFLAPPAAHRGSHAGPHHRVNRPSALCEYTFAHVPAQRGWAASLNGVGTSCWLHLCRGGS